VLAATRASHSQPERKPTSGSIFQKRYLSDLGKTQLECPIRGHGREDRRLNAPVARWYREHTEAFEEVGLGLALVPPSETFRFLLSTFMAMAPIPDHYTVVKSREEALAWAQGRLERKAGPTRASPALLTRTRAKAAG